MYTYLSKKRLEQSMFEKKQLQATPFLVYFIDAIESFSK